MSVDEPSTKVIRSFDETPIVYHSLGEADDVVLVGGGLRSGRDYLLLARALGRCLRVHVVDRRGRGESGPKARLTESRSNAETSCPSRNPAERVSHLAQIGGLVCLETALRASVFDAIAVFEPGVSVGGSFPSAWLSRSRELLNRGDDWGAFVNMVIGRRIRPAGDHTRSRMARPYHSPRWDQSAGMADYTPAPASSDRKN